MTYTDIKTMLSNFKKEITENKKAVDFTTGMKITKAFNDAVSELDIFTEYNKLMESVNAITGTNKPEKTSVFDAEKCKAKIAYILKIWALGLASVKTNKLTEKIGYTDKLTVTDIPESVITAETEKTCDEYIRHIAGRWVYTVKHDGKVPEFTDAQLEHLTTGIYSEKFTDYVNLVDKINSIDYTSGKLF